MAPAIMDKDGIWGRPTSTLDWCEENYVVTPYVAEFWNTISNISMIIPPAYCSYQFWKSGLELRHILSGIALLSVGIGSWFFHMTLLYEMQLMDELPMIYASCVFVYTLNHHSRMPGDWSKFLVICMLAVSIFVTTVYLYVIDPIFHQVCYATIVFYLFYEAYIAIKNLPKILPLAALSFATYAIGFVFWSIDNAFCSSLRNARTNILHPAVAPVTQFHAWWHVFVGIGTYLHVLVSAYARTLYLKRRCHIKFKGIFPCLEVGEVE